MAGKQNKKQPERPAYEAAWEKIRSGMLRDLAWKVYLRSGKPGQMARDDWACVTSQGEWGSGSTCSPTACSTWGWITSGGGR